MRNHSAVARAAGVVASLVGLAVWVYVVGYLVGWVRSLNESFRGPTLAPGSWVYWVHAILITTYELRWYGMLLAVLGFFLAVAGRTRATLGAAVLAVWLFLADAALHRLSLMDTPTRGLLAAAGFAVCGLVVASLVVGAASNDRDHVARVRRALVAVAAASTVGELLVIPKSRGEFGFLTGPPELPGVHVVTALVPAILCVVGVYAVAGALPRPPAQIVTATVALLLATAMGYGAFVNDSPKRWWVSVQIPFWFAVLVVVAATSALIVGARSGAAGWRWRLAEIIAIPVAICGGLAVSQAVVPVLIAIVGDDFDPLNGDPTSPLPGLALAIMALAWGLALTRITPAPFRLDLADTTAEPPHTAAPS